MKKQVFSFGCVFLGTVLGTVLGTNAFLSADDDVTPEVPIAESAESEASVVVDSTSVTDQGEKLIALLAQKLDPEEHSLDAPIRWAKAGMLQMQQEIQDYSCVVVKQERIRNRLLREERMFIKVRHNPFSVYIRFLEPKRLRGREVIYVEGACDGHLQAHGVGLEAAAGTVSLAPEGPLAMRGNLHPITHIGILNLARQLAEVGELQRKKTGVLVKTDLCEFNQTQCLRLEVLNSERRQDDPFHKAHIHVDVQRNIPIAYTAWGWSECADEPLPVIERYHYENIQINQNFTDLDFSIQNPAYNFREGKK